MNGKSCPHRATFSLESTRLGRKRSEFLATTLWMHSKTLQTATPHFNNKKEEPADEQVSFSIGDLFELVALHYMHIFLYIFFQHALTIGETYDMIVFIHSEKLVCTSASNGHNSQPIEIQTRNRQNQ